MSYGEFFLTYLKPIIKYRSVNAAKVKLMN